MCRTLRGFTENYDNIAAGSACGRENNVAGDANAGELRENAWGGGSDIVAGTNPGTLTAPYENIAAGSGAPLIEIP